MEIQIPPMNPRHYQVPLFRALDKGIKRAVLMWHRRAGKDACCLNYICKDAVLNPGNFWYMLPEKEQARKVIWNGVNPHTHKRIIDEIFPSFITKTKDKQQMVIELTNGSIIQLLGSDNYDSHVGGSPRGIVFSEYALSNPSAWNYMRPMLLENGGWAIFNSTVRGTNHFWQLAEFAKNDPAWFFSRLNADESGVFTPAQLESELRECIGQNGEDEGRAIFRQEYFNDPNAAIPGAYYGKWMSAAMDEGRISRVPYEPQYPVITAWDLGINDDNCIWFFQAVGKEIHVIDYYTNNNEGMAHYVKILKEKPYNYQEHLLPHDAGHREKGSGKTIQETLTDLGLYRTRVVPRTPTLARQIDDVRLMLPRCWFDEAKTKDGLSCLTNYHREWDDKLKVFRDSPKHDWASHGASAFATFAQGYEEICDYSEMPRFANSEYNPFA